MECLDPPLIFDVLESKDATSTFRVSEFGTHTHIRSAQCGLALSGVSPDGGVV